MTTIIEWLLALLNLYTILLVVRVLFSWLPPRAQANRLYEFLYAITEPVLRPFRRVLPPVGGLDLSPILLFLALAGIQSVLRRLT